MRRCIAHGLALGCLFASLGAAQGPNISEAKPAPSSSTQTKSEVRKQAGKPKAYQIGTASWYGDYFEGKPTASGEPYEMYDMTAAHLTLPLGSFVRVTNLRNGRAVVVRVNDRGPIVPGRIIDLSYSAAEALQFRSRGLQRVRLDVVKSTQVNAKLVHPGQAKPHYQTVAVNHPPVAALP
jgi:rare lipoprotein A